jgi:hypothetical protein
MAGRCSQRRKRGLFGSLARTGNCALREPAYFKHFCLRARARYAYERASCTVSKFRLTVVIDTKGLSPRELRQAFARALVTAILEAHRKDRITTPEAEELIRTVPSVERA